MENLEDEDNLKLVKASAGLLSGLESALPKLLWRPSSSTTSHGPVHRQVRKRDLDHVIKLIEPFQGEPQLLDVRLKYILPPIVEAYLEHLRLTPKAHAGKNVDLQTAICIILYTLCKVRGYKVIVGFLNNEPRYLEPVLGALEGTVSQQDAEPSQVAWQVPYVLLLWHSHLLLAPFDLASISTALLANKGTQELELPMDLPSVAFRSLQVGLRYLPTSTKAQDAAATMLVRLSIRPDMQKLHLADTLVQNALRLMQANNTGISTTVYERLGPLRFLAGIATSVELDHLVPPIYRTCEQLSNDTDSPTTASNAVAKKIIIKIFRNIAIFSLRSASAAGPLLSFLETTSVLEDVIDYLLRSLSERDTQVRYAAAKAISLIVQELDPTMGHEVTQAVLDTFKEDMLGHTSALDFRMAHPLKWHGLCLALAHSMFKRTASPEQLPDIVQALSSALQFEQRTATGSSVGTNVRDAANFGIWSLSRRYTTAELLTVDTCCLQLPGDPSTSSTRPSVIQALAIQLILSACLDPAGNIRRGSSAALQELIGRHPNQVQDGIALVQIVDYQAVGLRRRAMVDVAGHAAKLHAFYWEAIVEAVLGWRGIGSADVLSREAAAASLSNLSLLRPATSAMSVVEKVVRQLERCSTSDAETAHGLVLALAYVFQETRRPSGSAEMSLYGHRRHLWQISPQFSHFIANFSPRIIRSELPAAVARLLASLCHAELQSASLSFELKAAPFDTLDSLTERLLARHEDMILDAIPPLVKGALELKCKLGQPFGGIAAQTLCEKVAVDSTKNTLSGAGRAIALGALANAYQRGLTGKEAAAATGVLTSIMSSMSVDWRVIAMRALQLAVGDLQQDQTVEPQIIERILYAVHGGLNDYTIDERGDVGSLVRLQAISCTCSIFASQVFLGTGETTRVLGADIARLSLEKLDKVRIQAAQCRQRYLRFNRPVSDVASVSTYGYFYDALDPLRHQDRRPEIETALIEGCTSCAGISSESLLVASRQALAYSLYEIENSLLGLHMSTFAALLKGLVIVGANALPALELLAFLLDMQIPQRLANNEFKWRNLLSTVQKSHHRSTDVPRILAAIRVYRGLADMPSIRNEVVKKLINMLKTNPYPRVLVSVAETLLVVVDDQALRQHNWMKATVQNREAVEQLQSRHVIP